MSVQGAIPLSSRMAKRKLQALAFIEQYYASHGEGPSLSEIAAALDCNPMRAKDAVHKLHSEGRIHRTPGARRSIRPLSSDEEAVRRARQAGYIVMKTDLMSLPVLDHDPGDGEEETQAGGAETRDRPGAQAAH